MGLSELPDPGVDLAGRKILIVDDDRVNLRLLHAILRNHDFAFTEASSGEAALDAYASFAPDLVLLDVVLPGIDGLETCRQLRKRHGERSAPVIFITARGESNDVVRGFDAGGIDYLVKPFRANEVVARIRTHLQNRILIEQLSQANAAKNRVLGMAAHDLRNPLASIRGLTEFLLEGAVGQLTPDQLDLMRSIHDASHSMLDMVNDLLDTATIEAGELKLVIKPENLAELVMKSAALTNIEAAKKKTRVDVEVPAVPVMLPLDAAKVRQVADNLLSNAVKYSPPGSVITIVVAGDPAAKVASISVRDQGPGIPANERDKLFKDFSRLSVKPTGGEKSTGLGLAICRKIVEAHRGTIGAENLPDRGCEFRVTLPLSP
jgi:signal transduction histidine kinase